MDYLNPINVLEKIVPEAAADSGATFRTNRRDSQSQVTRTPDPTMAFPMRMHHLSMGAVLLTASVLIVVAGCTFNYDLCVKTSSDLEVIGRYITPSDRNGGFPQVIADLVATFVISLAIFCFYRWSSYPKFPAGIQKAIDNVNTEQPEMVQIMLKTFFMDLINLEIENFMAYFFLMIVFIFLAATDIYLPETLFRSNDPKDFRSMEVPTSCYIGFGFFGWFKPVIVVFVGGFAILCAVSVMNLYQDYLNLKRNEKMAVAGISGYTDVQNSAILLNVRFSNMTEMQMQNDMHAPPSKSINSLHPTVELNNSDAPNSDMKTVRY